MSICMPINIRGTRPLKLLYISIILINNKGVKNHLLIFKDITYSTALMKIERITLNQPGPQTDLIQQIMKICF